MKTCNYKCCRSCFKAGMTHVLNVIEKAERRQRQFVIRLAAIEAKRKEKVR